MGRRLDSVSCSLLVLLLSWLLSIYGHPPPSVKRWKHFKSSDFDFDQTFFCEFPFLLGNRVYWCGGVCDTTTSCCEKCVYSTVAVSAVYGKRPSVFREIHDKTDGNKMRCM